MSNASISTCPKCGDTLREGAEFCPKCGAAVSAGTASSQMPTGAPVSDVPFIALAPVEKRSIGKRIGRLVRMLVSVTLIVALCLGGLWIAAQLRTTVPTTPFEEVENTTYQNAIALINTIQGDSFDAVIKDVIRGEGAAEGYDIIADYEAQFDALITEESSEEEKAFVEAATYVWITEYQAQRYEYLAENGGLFKFRYEDNAVNYRKYANEVYSMLVEAESSVQLENIKIYCQARNIIATTD